MKRFGRTVYTLSIGLLMASVPARAACVDQPAVCAQHLERMRPGFSFGICAFPGGYTVPTGWADMVVTWFVRHVPVEPD